MDKPNKSPDPAKPNRNRVTAQRRPDEAIRDAMARVATSPEVQAAMTVRAYAGIPQDDVTTDALVVELVKQCQAGSKGDLSQGERMLVAQAHALDTVFGHLIRRARVADTIPQLEAYTRLALKAQSQCRATLETLSVIKNPSSVAFVRQANIAHGPQQVNNAAIPSLVSCAREIETPPNKLLEATDGERVDTGTASSAGAAHSQLEALGSLKRAEDGSGQDAG